MFKKNKKQTETIKEPKEKKVRTVKVGTHKKAVIALWVVLIASVSFGVYKNFTAIDQHTTHEKEIIEPVSYTHLFEITDNLCPATKNHLCRKSRKTA